MKTKKMFITVLLLSLVFGATVNATNERAINKAQNELRKQIQHEFNAFDLEYVSRLDQCNTLDITFQITNKNRIEIFKAESDNEDLLQFVNEIDKNRVIADDILQGKSYKVRFRFLKAQ